MKVAIYSATRDRLDYTKHCFATLREKAGHPYDLYVVDNGSEDGTQDWLRETASDYAGLILNEKNRGIRGAFEQIREHLKDKPYDLVISFDNDCEVVTDGILAKVSALLKGIDMEHWILSPRVDGLSYPPQPRDTALLNGAKVGVVDENVGCIFMIRDYADFMEFPLPAEISLGYGLDQAICHWHRSQGGRVGIIPGLVINHYETTKGQIERYPDYWQRKLEENGWA